MVILDLVEQLGSVAEGDAVTVAARAPDDVAAVRAWCERSGNTFIRDDAGQVVVRRGRPNPLASGPLASDPLASGPLASGPLASGPLASSPLASGLLRLAPDRRPGTRLWIYTNFDCNLACDYCCVRSSPRAQRRALGVDRIRRLAREAAAAGVAELLLTGGEPFLLPDLGELVAACTDVLPTTLLTNGMLFRGRRLETLQAMPRDRLRLQISLDSATPERHDAHRGPGTWARALAGIRTALGEGFTVRVAATLVTSDAVEERHLRGFLTDLGIAPEDQILRPLARRGFAETGVVLTTETLVPEVTVTADGVYWHPVGADDADTLVTAELFPLGPAITKVQELFASQRDQAEVAARSFPCA